MSRRLDDDWPEQVAVVKNTYRDQVTKEAFIKYLEKKTDERFFQALSNFTGIQYIGAASTFDGKNFQDLFHVEADKSFVYEEL